MTDAFAQTLAALADQYETPAFLTGDPAQFMHRYGTPRDQEVIAFIAANLAFGRREQILLHMEHVCDAIEKDAQDSPSLWIQSGAYRKLFVQSGASFYRMVSHRTMRLLCDTLQGLLAAHGTLGTAARSAYMATAGNPNRPPLHQSIAALFPAQCTVVCHGTTSCAKRLQLFLRWMVRDDSPVDLGLWSGWFSKAELLMPLDTHVMQQSVGLGLIAPTATGRTPAPTLALARRLTATLSQAFPGDPVRADYALFGLGIAKSPEQAMGIRAGEFL